MNAAEIAIGMGAEVYVFDRSIDRLRELDIAASTAAARPCYASTLEIEQRLPEVDLVIGAVLVHGAKAPHVITREQLALMKRSAVLVDVSIDQGGCFETSRPTTHTDPTYEVDGDHPLLRRQHARRRPDHLDVRAHQRDDAVRGRLADAGVRAALAADPGFLRGLNVAAGKVTYAPVALDQGLEFTPPQDVLGRSTAARRGSLGGRCYHPRRMPTTSQLSARAAPQAKKLSTPGLKSGKGRKKKVAAPSAAASARASTRRRRRSRTRRCARSPVSASPVASRSRPTSPARVTTCRSTPSCSCVVAASRTCRACATRSSAGRSTPPASATARRRARSTA